MYRYKRMLSQCAAAALMLGMGLAAHAQTPYQIGALFPMSGPMASFGNMYHDATELAVAHIAQDKMLSRPLAIDYEDSQAQPQPAVIAMNKMVRILHLPAILTGLSGVSKAIAPIGGRQKAVMINGGASSPDLAKLSPYFFNLIPLANDEVDHLLPYLAKQRKFKRIALVYVDDPLGQSVLASIQKSAPANGLQLAGSYPVSTSTAQFGAIAAKVKADNPDAVFLAYYGQQLISLSKQLRDNGVKVPFVGISTIGDPNFIRAPSGEGTIYVSQKIEWNSKDPLTSRFVKDYESKYKTTPSPYAVNYYNSVILLAQVMQSLEKKKIDIDGESLRKGIQEQKTFNLVGGAVTFQPDGTIHMPVQVNLISHGKLQTLNDEPASAGAGN
jgi:ABC-type branched-subunit amino acid transport system substrate-binding protein